MPTFQELTRRRNLRGTYLTQVMDQMRNIIGRQKVERDRLSSTYAADSF